MTGAHFEFPTLSQHLLLTAYEHTSIELPFRLDLNNCTLDHTFVLVSEPSAKYHIDYCILRLDNSGGCLSFSKERCRCESDGHAVLTKTVDKGDNGFWVWWTRESIAREVKVDFSIVQGEYRKCFLYFIPVTFSFVNALSVCLSLSLSLSSSSVFV